MLEIDLHSIECSIHDLVVRSAHVIEAWRSVPLTRELIYSIDNKFDSFQSCPICSGYATILIVLVVSTASHRGLADRRKYEPQRGQFNAL